LVKFKVSRKSYFPRLLTIFDQINTIFGTGFFGEFWFLGSKKFTQSFFGGKCSKWAKGFSLKLLSWFLINFWKSHRLCRSVSVYDKRRNLRKMKSVKSLPLIFKLWVLSSLIYNFRSKLMKKSCTENKKWGKKQYTEKNAIQDSL